MKKLLILLTMTLSLNASLFQEDDKQLHMGFSTVVGMAGNAICYQELGLTAGQSWWCGIGAAFLVGAAKEAYDRNHGGEFDNRDMQANLIGGVIGSTGLYTIYTW